MHQSNTQADPVRMLPPHLAERAVALNAHNIDPAGEFVLCWLHHAIRDHDNPALDAAIEIANHARHPVLVYQGLGGAHRFNSDRHHAFILQGARDLAAGLDQRGIAYAFHLPTDPETRGPIRGLIRRAAAIVTEDFPAPPFPAWAAAHARRASCAMIAVDCACIMPLRHLTARFDRAFKFRDKASRAWDARILEPWTDATPATTQSADDALKLGFDPIDLQHADITALCAQCRIDHTVPPVARAVGGSIAGYQRWDEFRDRHLTRYHNRRNDATAMDAVSCLSPYLHHGHVSPFRIAREARAVGGAGAEKFLDELLVWRELAHNFCAHTPHHQIESLAAIPQWAQDTLARHARDEREKIYAWEQLAHARTGDELWDWAQRSLIRNGELHNNLRMTWGKMLPRWTRSPERALATLIDLNHRYALDGNNPNSYGGLLWCMGQFDRPFEPERPVMGTVRDRTTDGHADRLDIMKYAASVRARTGLKPMRVAVIGGGISGLACARTLSDQGCEVTVYDQGRSVGGRLATRRSRDPNAPAFDHGAPFFRITDERFARYARSWVEMGICAAWQPTTATWDGRSLSPDPSEHAVAIGTPGMDAICAHLASGLAVVSSTAVRAIERAGDLWTLATDNKATGEPEHAEGFDAVVVAAASAQSARVVAEFSGPIRDALERSTSRPIWVLMAEVGPEDRGGSQDNKSALDRLPELLRVSGDPVIDKVIRDDAKPGRAKAPGSARLVVHAGSDWSRDRYDLPKEQVAQELSGELIRLLSAVTGEPTSAFQCRLTAAHRWGLARAATLAPEQCAFDESQSLAVCGDGFAASIGDDSDRLEHGVQNAFLSGVAAAGRVLSLRKAAESPASDDDAPTLW